MSSRDWVLLWRLIRAHWLDRFAGTWAGALWGLALPVGQMAVFWLVFAEWMGPRVGPAIERLGAGGYALFLLTGLIFWWWWSNGLLRGCNALLEGAQLARKTPLRLWWLVAAPLAAEGIGAAVALGLLLGLMALLGLGGWRWLGLVPLCLFTGGMLLGLGLILAVFEVFIPDTREVLGLVLNLWFWLTPVVYPPEGAPAALQGVLAWNPAAWVVTAAQELLLWGRWPAWGLWLKLALGCVLALAAAIWLWRRTAGAVRDAL